MDLRPLLLSTNGPGSMHPADGGITPSVPRFMGALAARTAPVAGALPLPPTASVAAALSPIAFKPD